MPYGTASPETLACLVAAGIDVACVEPEDDGPTFDVDVVFEGALDESFAVSANMAAEVGEAIYRDLLARFPDRDYEVTIYEAHEDHGDLLRLWSHPVEGALG